MEENKAPQNTISGPFRQVSLDRLDVAVQIDNQLPLVPRRIWLIVAGCFLLLAAGLLWAAYTPSQTSINSTGRVVAPGGLVIVSAPVTGTVASVMPAMGMRVTGDRPLFTIRSAEGMTPVESMAAGEVWQDLVSLGQGVLQGQKLLTIIPDNSQQTVVAQVPEVQATNVQVGQKVYIQAPEILSGTVSAIQAPLPADLVGPRIGLELDPGQLYVLVTIALDTPAHPGEQVDVRIILSDKSVLSRLLSN